MAFYLCRSNPNSYVVNRKYGFDIVDESTLNNSRHCEPFNNA